MAEKHIAICDVCGKSEECTLGSWVREQWNGPHGWPSMNFCSEECLAEAKPTVRVAGRMQGEP